MKQREDKKKQQQITVQVYTEGTGDNSSERSLLRESDDPSLSKSGVILHMVRVLKN